MLCAQSYPPVRACYVAPLQGIPDSSFNVVDVQWAWRDFFGGAAWQREYSGAVTDIEGGSEVELTLTVSAPSDLEAGVKCVALVVADEVTPRAPYSRLRQRAGDFNFHDCFAKYDIPAKQRVE